jgi:hypothetical protein
MEARVLSAGRLAGNGAGVLGLTENGSGRIVTGETGLAHTRTGIQSALVLGVLYSMPLLRDSPASAMLMV